MDISVGEYIQKIKNEKNIIIQAKYLRFLHVDKQIRTKDLAKMLNLNPSYICHLYRLNRLPEYVIDGYYGKTITKSALFTLSRLHTPEEMFKAYEEVLQKNLTPNETEETVRKIKHRIESDGLRLTEEEKKELTQQVKTKYQNAQLKIIQTRIRGNIIFSIKGGYTKTTELMRKVLLSIVKGL